MIPSATFLKIREACNCFASTGKRRTNRTELFGMIKRGRELMFKSPSIFQCCILIAPIGLSGLDRRPRKVAQFWIAFRKKLREVPIEVRIEEDFKLAASRLIEQLSAKVPIAEKEDLVAVLTELSGRAKRRLAEQVKCEEVEREQQLKQEIDYFVSIAKQNAQNQNLPECFRILQFKQIPTIEALKYQWKKLARIHHPDISADGDPETFKVLRVAYEEARQFFSKRKH